MALLPFALQCMFDVISEKKNLQNANKPLGGKSREKFFTQLQRTDADTCCCMDFGGISRALRWANGVGRTWSGTGLAGF